MARLTRRQGKKNVYDGLWLLPPGQNGPEYRVAEVRHCDPAARRGASTKVGNREVVRESVDGSDVFEVRLK